MRNRTTNEEVFERLQTATERYSRRRERAQNVRGRSRNEAKHFSLFLNLASHSCKATNFALCLMLFLALQPAQARPMVVAHRGGISLGPENRLVTFEKALALGVDAVELDIHQSQDGRLMVIHDLTLNRCFGRSGRVDRMTSRELQEIGVPTLKEVMRQVNGRCRLVIEIKQPKDGTHHHGIEKRLVNLIEEESLADSVMVISFYEESIHKVNQLAPHLDKAFLFRHAPKDLRGLKEKLGLSHLGPKHTTVSREFLKEAHRLGLKVNPWTVNGTESLARFSELGCDAITTNDPHLLLDIVGRTWFR